MYWAVNQSYQLNWSFTFSYCFVWRIWIYLHIRVAFCNIFLPFPRVANSNKVANVSQISQFYSFCTESVPRLNQVQLFRSCQPTARWFYEKEFYFKWASKDTPGITPKAVCPWTKDQIRHYSGKSCIIINVNIITSIENMAIYIPHVQKLLKVSPWEISVL